MLFVTSYRRTGLILPIAAAAMVAGCGGTTEIDQAKTESAVTEAVAKGGVTTRSRCRVRRA